MRLFVLAIALAACAPVVDGPAERQRVADRGDGERLTAQLSALPGVVRAEVLLRRPIADPLSVAPAAVDSLSIVVIVDDRADRTMITGQARQLALAAAPGIEPALVIDVGAIRPELASIGPFSVEAKSRTPLKTSLVIVLALVVVLASWIAWRERRSTEQRRVA